MMTIDQLLKKFENAILRGLEPGESADDVRMAARVIIERRLAFTERQEPVQDDAVVALWALCFIPIPGGPPKTPEYKDKAKRYRRKKVRRIKNEREKQKQVRADIKEKLLYVTPGDLPHVRCEDLFETSEPTSTFEPPQAQY